MGRRRADGTTKKGYYFMEEEEQAVKDYIAETDIVKKNEIFNNKLLPAFTKMVECIINRYKLYPPNEEFQETFNDTISFLMTKIEKFNPNSGYKAYSYCGTICKNYLIFKVNQFSKLQKKVESYETRDDIDNNINYSYDESSIRLGILQDIIKETSNKIKAIINNPQLDVPLKENEIKVGNALCGLLDNWEELFVQMGSNKFNKSTILYYLREATLLSTVEIRNSMKKYKTAYQDIKDKIMSEN